MSNFKDAARCFVLRIVEQTKETPTWVAKEARLSPSTVNNFLKDPTKHTLSLRTVEKLETLCVRLGLPLRFRDFLHEGESSEGEDAAAA